MSADGRDSVIGESVLAFGAALGVRVVAEGIDRQDVWSRLCRLGCEFGQGCLVGRPMTPLAFGRWLQRWDGNPLASAREGARAG